MGADGGADGNQYATLRSQRTFTAIGGICIKKTGHVDGDKFATADQPEATTDLAAQRGSLH
jgi:hypothetical protein